MSDKSLGRYQVCCCYSNFQCVAAVSHRECICAMWQPRYLICLWQYTITGAFILDFIWSWTRWQWILTHLDQPKSYQLHKNEATFLVWVFLVFFFPLSKAVSFGGFLEATSIQQFMRKKNKHFIFLIPLIIVWPPCWLIYATHTFAFSVGSGATCVLFKCLSSCVLKSLFYDVLRAPDPYPFSLPAQSDNISKCYIALYVVDSPIKSNVCMLSIWLGTIISKMQHLSHQPTNLRINELVGLSGCPCLSKGKYDEDGFFKMKHVSFGSM